MKVISVLLVVLCGVIGKVYDSCSKPGMMALTFVDGASKHTSQLLAILKSKGVRATFHFTTRYLTDPKVQNAIFAVSAAGHLIGLRAEYEWKLLEMSNDEIRAAISRQSRILASYIGYYPKFVRLPINGYDDRVLQAVVSTGAIVTRHNLETYEYTNDSVRTLNAVKLATSLIAPGAGRFILTQNYRSHKFVAVIGKIIEHAWKEHYEMVSLDTCLGMVDMTKNTQPLGNAHNANKCLCRTFPDIMKMSRGQKKKLPRPSNSIY